MKAVILAAGEGKRLKELTKDAPKCMIKLAGETLLDREIHMLKDLGFSGEDIFVVSGYRHECLENCGAEVIFNSEYKSTDNAYSLGLALRRIGTDDDVIVMDSDLIFERSVLEMAVNSEKRNLVLSKKSEDLSESTGIATKADGTVEAIGKQYSNTGFVYISIFKFGKEVTREFTEALMEPRSVKTWYTLALTKVMQKYPFYNLPVPGLWHEIDFPEDYQEAKEIFETGE